MKTDSPSKTAERAKADADYDAALAAFRVACKPYSAARHAYHKREIEDAQFLDARKDFNAASDAFDAAESFYIRLCEIHPE